MRSITSRPTGLACLFHGGTFDEVKRGFRGARAVPAEPESHAGLFAVNGRVIFYLTDHGIAGRSGQMSTGGRKKITRPFTRYRACSPFYNEPQAIQIGLNDVQSERP